MTAKEYLQKIRSERLEIVQLQETVDELKEPLTKTERRVLHLLCEGLNADEICEIMEISYSGIKFHNKNIYRKLGVTNRNEAVRKAFLLGLREVGTMVE